jgi:ferredoxin
MQQTIQPFSDELVIIGAPVYGGRVPVDAIKRLKNLKADNTLAVLVVVYGNREFEDALLELKNLSIELGFHPVAGAAFIGEHSFATEDVPIANGRPDRQDAQRAMDFGAGIKDKIAALKSPDVQTDLEFPGSFPYEAGGARPMAVAPVTLEDTCTVCGTCASVCPTAAISVNGSVATEIKLCIRCCACIKNCPEGARVIESSKWKNIATWLNENCSARKEPQMFGVDV